MRTVAALVVAVVALVGVGTVQARVSARHAGDALLAAGAPLADGGPPADGAPLADGAALADGASLADVPDVPRPDGFHRFRLGPVDGVPFRPNRRDLAARTVANGPLLLFLPATRAAPRDYTAFLTAATGAGYHVLGLDYWNLGRTLSATCAGSPSCYTQVQRNRFDGSSGSPWSDVRPGGSIESRLRGALRHLDVADPAGGWGRFVHGDRLQWRHVVVAGHSQGGSQAAFIGHVRHVDGVLMLGAPAISDGAMHASWLDRPGRTPADRYYGLMHVDDRFGRFIRPSWRTLRLPGARTPFVGGSRTPYGDPHVIVTRIPVDDGRAAHSVVASDRTLRDALGNPVLLPTWNWMLGRFDEPLTHPQPSDGARG